MLKLKSLIGLISLTGVLILFSLPGYSQTVIHGTTMSDKGELMPLVNVYIEGSYRGTSSDMDGHYTLRAQMSGRVMLIASFVGYMPVEKDISLEGDSIEVNFILCQSSEKLEEIIITAGSFEASDEKRNVTFRASDIGTTAGATGDISGAIESLPGTQYNGNMNGLFVRGGSGHETKVIIDEMEVQNPYYSPVPDIKQRGRFDPFMFSGTVFSTGGYSAQYGQALSSVLVLKSKNLADSTNTGGGIHFYGGRLFHTHRWEETSAHLDVSFNDLSFYHSLMNIKRYTRSPENYSGTFIFRHMPNERSIFKFYSVKSATYMKVKIYDSVDSENMPEFKLDNRNDFLIMSYKSYSKNDKWSILLGASHSRDVDDSFIDTLDTSEVEQLRQLKIVLSNKSNSSFTITGGSELQFFNTQGTIDGRHKLIQTYLSASFLESKINISEKAAIQAGLRMEYSDLNKKVELSPRLSMAYKTGPSSQISAATGLFCQKPENQYLYLMTRHLNNERSAHYIISYQWDKNDRLLRIEAYDKQYRNLILISDSEHELTNDGNGYACGIDLFFRDRNTMRDGEYWISYSFLDTKRLYRDYPVKAPPEFTSRHNINIVWKYWIQRLNSMAGLSYNYSSGKPYFNPDNSPDNFNADRTRDYHSLDMNLSWMTNIFKRRATVYISSTNLFGRDNIFGYKYLHDQDLLIPLKPASRRSLFFGVFISTY